MDTVRIEGLATISKDGFHFDSGMPSNEPVLGEAMKMRGVMKVSQNACAEFLPSSKVILPPEIHSVSQGLNYNVKRTTRHYLIQMKVPVVESRVVSQQKLEDIVTVAMGDITLDRKELLNV